MTKSTRARYTLEFKEEAVRLVTGGERVAPGILACRSRRCITGLRTDAEISDPFGSPKFKGFSSIHGSELYHLFLRLS